uniref:26S proteasome regulatory subunit 8 n=1 Tax=Steinernema glaseri TaxID=37863 RepID=A0A1I7ZUS6_9BILA
MATPASCDLPEKHKSGQNDRSLEIIYDATEASQKSDRQIGRFDPWSQSSTLKAEKIGNITVPPLGVGSPEYGSAQGSRTTVKRCRGPWNKSLDRDCNATVTKKGSQVGSRTELNSYREAMRASKAHRVSLHGAETSSRLGCGGPWFTVRKVYGQSSSQGLRGGGTVAGKVVLGFPFLLAPDENGFTGPEASFDLEGSSARVNIVLAITGPERISLCVQFATADERALVICLPSVFKLQRRPRPIVDDSLSPRGSSHRRERTHHLPTVDVNSQRLAALQRLPFYYWSRHDLSVCDDDDNSNRLASHRICLVCRIAISNFSRIYPCSPIFYHQVSHKMVSSIEMSPPAAGLMVASPTNRGEEQTLKTYYRTKIEDAQQRVHEKTMNVRRLQAQRNELNAKVRMLKEELQQLHEQGSYVGEVSKAMDKKKVLVKVHPEGKYVVDIDKGIDISQITPGCRVALRADSYALHKVLPNKVDPLVSLMMVEKVPDSTYEMIGGLDKQIKEIKEVIELPVKHPELFEALGIAQPKGVLLYGPPGTGKTLLARAVAHHTECTFIRVSGSELVQKFIGEGARMVRELFVMAREHAPSIIFMDEIDSIGSSRVEGSSGGDSEVQRTMLELLNQLDGFEATKNIKVIMATNRIDILDPALLRPGRIDRKIEFPAPDEKARADILKIHSRKMNLMRVINMRKIAEAIPGASGAEVKAVCTEAGMFALRERRIHVTQEDFEMAVGKVMQKDSEKNMSIKKLWK